MRRSGAAATPRCSSRGAQRPRYAASAARPTLPTPWPQPGPSDGAPVIEPVLVHRLGDRRPCRVELAPGASEPGRLGRRSTLEDGDGHGADRVLGRPSRARWRRTVDGRRVALELRLGRRPARIPPGYHASSSRAPGVEADAAAGRRRPVPAARRGWGVVPARCTPCAPTRPGGGQLHRPRELAQLDRRPRRLTSSATLPLYPAFLEPPVEPSPYLPVTRLGWSELYVDPTALPELELAPGGPRTCSARRSSATAWPARTGAGAGRPRAVWPACAPACSSRWPRPLSAPPSAAARPLEAFAAAHPELVAYARFRADRERHGRDRGGRLGRPPSASGRSSDAGLDGRRRCALPPVRPQWRGRRPARRGSPAARAGLYLDLPVGVHPRGLRPVVGARRLRRAGVAAGAPPDPFFAGGQDWAFPPLHPGGIADQRLPLPDRRPAPRLRATRRCCGSTT